MRKQYLIENLDCAHCAMKMENAAKKIDGVTFVSVNFVSMKLTLEADDAIFKKVHKEVERACKAVEPDVVFHQNKYKMSTLELKDVYTIIIAVVLFIAAKLLESFEITAEGELFHLLSFIPAYLVSGFIVIKKAFLGIIHGKIFDENFLMTIATFGAFAIGESGEGVMVMLLYRIGEFFQSLAVSKSRRSITELMDIRPDSANLIDGDETKRVNPKDIPIGSLILVKPGEKIPIDSVVIEGDSFLDTTALTGESVPRAVTVGDTLVSGCINMGGVLTAKTEKSFEESSVSKILSMIEDSSEKKSKTENFISRFAKYYTPIVVVLALILAVVPPLFNGEWAVWIRKAITCLVISCPCALVISVPLTFFGAIGGASRNGILIKGTDCVEKLAKAELCAFDKTGTLTKGNFKVTAIHPEIISQDELLELAATCENYSDHPISASLKAAFNKEINKARIGKIEEIFGKGVRAEIDGKTYLVGNDKLMQESQIEITPCDKCKHAGTVVHISSTDTYLGHIVISDELKSDSKEAITKLEKLKIKDLYLISGDREDVADSVANELGIKNVYSSLLPHQKLSVVEEIEKQKSQKGSLLFVGDGINDSPVLARADLGIAMGNIGADAAMEAADVVLIDDKPSKVALAIRIAKKALNIVYQNIVLSIGIKVLVLLLNIFLGEAGVPIALAVFADVGVCIIAVLNATRTLIIKKK